LAVCREKGGKVKALSNHLLLLVSPLDLATATLTGIRGRGQILKGGEGREERHRRRPGGQDLLTRAGMRRARGLSFLPQPLGERTKEERKRKKLCFYATTKR